MRNLWKIRERLKIILSFFSGYNPCELRQTKLAVYCGVGGAESEIGRFHSPEVLDNEHGLMGVFTFMFASHVSYWLDTIGKRVVL